MIEIEEVGKKLENYMVNAYPGKAVYVLNDYEKKDEQQDKKGAEKKRAGTRASVVENKVEKVEKEIDLKPEQKKNIEEFTLWDYLYPAFELFTNNQKIN